MNGYLFLGMSVIIVFAVVCGIVWVLARVVVSAVRHSRRKAGHW